MERQTLGNHPTAERLTQHNHHPVHVLRASTVTETPSCIEWSSVNFNTGEWILGFSLLPPSENEGGGKNRREGFQGVKRSGSNKQDCLWKRLRRSRTSWINERKERLKNGDFTEAEFSNLMCPASVYVCCCLQWPSWTARLLASVYQNPNQNPSRLQKKLEQLHSLMPTQSKSVKSSSSRF